LHLQLTFLQGLASAVKQQSQQLSSFAQQLLLGVVQQAKQQQQQQQQQQLDAAAAATPLHSKDSWQVAVPASTVALLAGLCSKHRTAVASILMATAPLSLPSKRSTLTKQFDQQLTESLCTFVVIRCCLVLCELVLQDGCLPADKA
jgi:ElaB/YqjD/DUF883 family membrane-anchored ribosome-binding protein